MAGKPKTFEEWEEPKLSILVDEGDWGRKMAWNAAIDACCEAVRKGCLRCDGTGRRIIAGSEKGGPVECPCQCVEATGVIQALKADVGG